MADPYRERHWTKHLPDDFLIQVSLRTAGPEIISFSVALVKDGRCITRYDNAHGFAHRDVLGRKSASPLEKERFNSLTSSEVFNYAIKDIAKNYAKYYEEFQEN